LFRNTLNRLLLFSFCLAFTCAAFGQEAEFKDARTDSLHRIGVCDEDGFCEPGIKGMPRPKGFSIVQENIMDYGIRTKEVRENRNFNNEIERNKELEVNLRFPVLMKKSYSLIFGLEYKVEEFQFENPNDLENDFIRDLEDKHLRKYGFKVYFSKSFKGNKYIYTRTSFSLNGDLGSEEFKSSAYQDFFRFSFSGIYGTKVNSSKTYGFGLSYSYNFGDLSIFPVFYYNKQWTDQWGVELRLPIKTELRYFPNKKNLLYFTNRLAGDSYILKLSSLQEQNTFLGIASYRSMIRYEREIYDFLWFTAAAGMRVNINFDLSDRDDFINDRDPFIENELATATFFQFGIFLVPPRKMMNRR